MVAEKIVLGTDQSISDMSLNQICIPSLAVNVVYCSYNFKYKGKGSEFLPLLEDTRLQPPLYCKLSSLVV